MTTPQSLERFLAWLDEEIERGRERLNSNKGMDMNSYGCGYDSGWLDGMKEVRAYYMGEIDE